MPIEDKISSAYALIENRLRASSDPVLCISFGKDSMVMLDLFRRAGHTLPVIYWKREHRFPEKNKFANEIIEKYDLEVYDYPPESTMMVKKGEQIEVMNLFSIGKHTMEVPTEIAPYKEGERYLCGLFDMYLKPTGKYDFRWDAMFLGQKSSDVDPLRGAVPLLVDEYKHNADTPIFSFPLRHFTDDDIWEYSRRFDVPQDTRRYSGDETFNNDRYPACTACINPDNPKTVYCPKYKMEIPNMSQRVVWADKVFRPAYVGPEKPAATAA